MSARAASARPRDFHGPFSAADLDCLDVLCDNYASGLVFARAKPRPSALDAVVARLRAAGMVEADTFLPLPPVIAAWRDRSTKFPLTSLSAAHPADEVDATLPESAPVPSEANVTSASDGTLVSPRPSGSDLAAEIARHCASSEISRNSFLLSSGLSASTCAPCW